MKPSLWFEFAMLVLILIVSLLHVGANESEKPRDAGGDKTVTATSARVELSGAGLGTQVAPGFRTLPPERGIDLE